MDRFCKKCGCPIADGSKYCFSCGAKFEDSVQPPVDVFSAPAVENNVVNESDTVIAESTEPMVDTVVSEAEKPVNEVGAEQQDSGEYAFQQPVYADAPSSGYDVAVQPKKGAKRIIKIIALIVVLLVILSSVGFCFYDYFSDKSSISYVISDYVDAVYLGEYEKAEGMMPESVLEDEDQKDLYESLIEGSDPEEVAEQRSTDLDEYFGTDIVISVNVTEFARISGDARLVCSDIFGYSFNYHYDFDKLYRVAFDVNIKGSITEETYTHYVYALEFDGEWYLFSMNYMYFTVIDVYAVGYGVEIDSLFAEDDYTFYD